MKPFDPFTATFEEAMAHPDALSVSRWGRAQELISCRDRYEADPMAGVYLCATSDLPMPDWLAAAFARGYEQVLGCRVDSWDEAFGAPIKKGGQLARARHRRRVTPLIFQDVTEAMIREPSTALNVLIERIGCAHGVGKTLAHELYNSACERFGYGGARTKAAITGSAKRQPATLRKLAGIKRRR